MDEKWFDNNGSPDSLFSMMLVQTDAVNCIGDGRKWATEYFHELAGTFSETQASACLRIAEAFRKVSGIAGEMSALIGSWNDTENMLGNFHSPAVRKKLAALIDTAGQEDVAAYKEMKALLTHI